MTALVAQSPVLSPKPGITASINRNVHPKAKALAILNSSHSPALSVPGPNATAASTPGDGGLDLAEQMNKETREKYVTGDRLGEGTYAVVYSGHFRSDPARLVAIKKIKVQQEWKDGIPMDAIREIKFLQELEHPNIIKLYDVYSTKDQNISLVLEHLPLGDLEGLWKNKEISYTSADIKSWSNMLAQAIWWCHEHFVLHRDIKGNNLLIAADGTVKLADFGLARSFADAGRPMTHVVITRFYRPPELLYGARHYSGKVDIWSVGCVIAELAIRRFFLTGDSDLGQLAVICEHFGTPTEETWPGVSKLEYYIKPSEQQSWQGNGTAPRKGYPSSWWKAAFPLLGDDGIDLLRAMLTPDPNKRLSAKQVLDHPYWTNAPRPTKKENLPKQGGGEMKMGADLKRRGGEAESGRADKVARKLDFGAMKK
ncbi:Pkinase-domain-containing protein [Aaosphaeria arxii CBS 175.79]|uniref:Pkinase-domain-containing protein n=1 Tax=Aaosphaeria arxii CBS 175.79 TaxID=1450172 RepID=A0A6A5XKI1_9PLEO|nr:Pkinase-domain-containing protein [Aaosphaeria arxii CBS 175.79]KAF2013642.1 Pkinase-domain-containing protein [Aaosphaeria arxii CBS 175.79]